MTNLTQNSFLYMSISIIYMFRASKCSSSGDSIVLIRYMVHVTLCRWPSGIQVWTERSNLHTRRSEWHILYIVLIQLNLLMMSTWMLETC